MLRIPHCLDSRLTNGGEVISPTHRPRCTTQKHYFSVSGTHFRPPLWSEFLATDPEAGFDSRHYQKENVVGLERGPLSLVSTTEELLDRKVAAPV
jgi:hypothetical protein